MALPSWWLISWWTSSLQVTGTISVSLASSTWWWMSWASYSRPCWLCTHLLQSEITTIASKRAIFWQGTLWHPACFTHQLDRTKKRINSWEQQNWRVAPEWIQWSSSSEKWTQAVTLICLKRVSWKPSLPYYGSTINFGMMRQRLVVHGQLVWKKAPYNWDNRFFFLKCWWMNVLRASYNVSFIAG